jgi:Mce-associated membrane protein
VTAKKSPVAEKTKVAEKATDLEEATEVSDTTDAEETVDAEETAAVDEEQAGDDAQPGRLKRWAATLQPVTSRVQRLAGGRMLSILGAILVVASLSLMGALFYVWFRPDRATDDAAARAAVSAAKDGTIAILSYSPDTLDNDFSTARSHLTGEFLSYYDQFTKQIVAPAAKQKAVKTSAVVLRAGLSDIHPDSAVVLLFVNQSTQSADRPEPTLSSSSVTVTLTKADGKWLISSFNPV